MNFHYVSVVSPTACQPPSLSSFTQSFKNPMKLLNSFTLIFSILVASSVLYAQSEPIRIFGSSSGEHFCSIHDANDNNALKCWGLNSNGQLGVGDYINRGDSPYPQSAIVAVNLDPDTPSSASLGNAFTCALLTSKNVKCWGNNSQGQLGLGSTTTVPQPSAIVDLSVLTLGDASVIQITSGKEFSCVIIQLGTRVKCWGNNLYGQLGYGDTNSRGDNTGEMGLNLNAVDLHPTLKPIFIVAGESHVCVIFNDSGSVKCWGRNTNGQLGLGDTNNRGDAPGEMGALLPFVNLGTNVFAKSVTAHGFATCVITTDDKSKCFGTGKSGVLGYASTAQLGDGPSEMGDALPFHVFEGVFKPSKIIGGSDFSCARLGDGSDVKVKCWGNNASGQLGMGNTLSYSDSSTEVLSATAPTFPFIDLGVMTAPVVDVACSMQSTCVLLQSAGVKCFGSNARGQLGIMNTVDKGKVDGEMGEFLLAVLYNQQPMPTAAPTVPTMSPTTMAPTNPTIRPTTASPVVPTLPTSSPTVSPTVVLLDSPVSCNPFPYGNCTIGSMKMTSNAKCLCKACPPGSYKTDNTKVVCTACGGVGNYCPNGSSSPLQPANGHCTYWTDPEYTQTTTATTEFRTSNPYLPYTQTFSMVTVSGTDSLLSTYTGADIWGKERYGGLKKFRTSTALCGALQVDDTSISIEALVPGVASKRITIRNTGGLPINVTAVVPDYASLFESVSVASLVDGFVVIEPYSTATLDLEIQTYEIPDSAIVADNDEAGAVNFTITLNWKQYWSQSDSGVETFGTPGKINVLADLKSGKMVFTPETIDIVLDSETTRMQRVTLYNVLPQTQEWILKPINYLTHSYDSWISFPNVTDGNMTASCSCTKLDTCVASDSNEGDKYKVSLLLTFNSSGLPAGVYRAKLIILSQFSGEISIPVSMTVKAGVMDASMTTWTWSDVADSNNIIRVNNKLTLKVIPRDKYGSETLIPPSGYALTDINYLLSWHVVSGNCPPQYNNGTCAKSKYITYTDAGWVTQVQFPATATFGLTLLMNGTKPISGVPNNNIFVESVECALYDSNAIPTTFGDGCKCISGYGIAAESGVYVSCKECEPGTYDDGTSKCIACGDGLYQDLKGQTSCKQCQSKAYQASDDKKSCTQCAAGYVVGAITPTSLSCEKCPLGLYAQQGFTSCQYCAAGLQPVDGVRCEQCTSGKAVNATGSGSLFCEDCPEGMVAASGDVSCSYCPSKAFEPSTDRSGCIACSAGSVVKENEFTCSKCPLGMIAQTGATTCSLCPSKAFEPNADRSACTACSGGYVVNATGETGYFCEKCPEGLVAPQGSTECAKCPSHAFEPNDLQSGCNPCNGGSVVNATGSGSYKCESCPVGTIAPLGATKCTTCQDRIHAPNDDATACDLCPDNRLVLPNDPKWICVPCGSDRIVKLDESTEDPTDYFCACHPTYMNVLDPKTGDITCEICPVGGYCAYRFKNDLLPLNGYWQVPWDPNIFQQCRHNSSCPGVVINNAAELLDNSIISARLANYTATMQQYTVANPIGVTCPGQPLCATGYTGPMCVKCEFGYTRVGEAICNKCLGASVTIALLVAGLTAAVVITVYIIRRTIMMTEKESSEVLLLKIMTSHMQMISMSATFRFNWPVWVLQFFSILDLISSAGQTLLSLDCLVDPKDIHHECGANTTAATYADDGVFDSNRILTFFVEATAIGLIPVIWAFCAAIFWVGAYYRVKKTQGRSRGKSFYNYFIISNIVVMFLLYPTLARTSLKFYSCSYETMEGVRLLEADFNVQCWGKAHLNWIIVGLLMTIFYAIGIPLGTYFVLRKNVGKKSKYREAYGFVFTGYSQERYYWEIVIMMRKFSFAFIAVVFRPLGEEVQGYCGILVLIVALQLQAYYKPYTSPQINFIENFGITTSFSTIFFGLFIASGDIDKSGVAAIFLSIIIIVMNTGFIMYALWQLYKIMYLSRKGQLPEIFKSKNRSSLPPSADGKNDSASKSSKKVPNSRDESGAVIPKSTASSDSNDAQAKQALTPAANIPIAVPVGSNNGGSQVISANVL